MRRLSVSAILIAVLGLVATVRGDTPPVTHLLYVAVPGCGAEIQHGGQGVLIFDIDHGYRCVRRITLGWTDSSWRSVRGICASAVTGRLYVSTTTDLTCVDLATDRVVWHKDYDGGCDRMALSADGKTMYLPACEGSHWNIIDASNGDVLKTIVTNSHSHNTICSLDGTHVFMAGIQSHDLTVLQTSDNTVERKIGPFGNFIRPFTINGKATLGFMCVNDLLGFEVADLTAGKVLYRVEIQGFQKNADNSHSCPSHGIALSADEKEIWVDDYFNSRVHIFDAATTPPKEKLSIQLRDHPGWISFSIDGGTAYASTGDMIDAKTHKIIAGLRDETGQNVESEKMIEIDFAGSKPAAVGNQFGIGQVR